ncbi:MAG TPA: hypothetical protein VKV27_01570 [Solirubrobacteraceae bacterium]|nr:hypothetical protein [Solirubrobacteraceae bacterium]
MDDELPVFYSGPRSNFGWGVYATDIEPTDGESWEQVSIDCFGGEATQAELSWCFVLHRGDAQEAFVQVNASEWMIERLAPNEGVEADTLVIEVRRWDGQGWEVVAEWDGSEWVPQNDVP